MFKKHKAEKAAKEYEKALAEWQMHRDGYANLVEIAQSFDGVPTDEIMLKDGETLFCEVSGCSLVEERRGQGHYQGGSTGVSIPIGSIGGRSVRYRVGATRGHYVQGAPVPTSIDSGTLFVTNQRVVFVGNNQTRECFYAKTIGVAHDDSVGETTISVSNRQKPTVIHYGPAVAGEVDFRIELAVAHFKGTVPQLVSQMRTELAQIDSERPKDPAAAAAPIAPTGPTAPAASTAPPGPTAPGMQRLPPPPSGPVLPVVPPTDHDAGWEWLYFASELARGLAACQPQYLEYQSQAVGVAGDAVADPEANIRLLSDEMSSVVAKANGLLDPALMEQALGPPGKPGNEEVIRVVTAGLTGVYADMISWGLRVRGANVEPKWQPAYTALSKYVSLPLHQFQDFSAALSTRMSQLVTDLRAGKTPDPEVDMTLTLTVEPTATSEFNAAMAAIRKAS
jgi:hypothetical protein